MRPVVGLEAVAHDACPASVGEAATARDTRAPSSLSDDGAGGLYVVALVGGGRKHGAT